MAFDKARTALTNIEDRVRRVFGLVGTANLGIDYDVKLVALAADLTRVGSSPFRGRRLGIAVRTTAAVATDFGWVVRLACDFVCKRIYLCAAGAATINGLDMWFLTPNLAPVNAAALQAGTWFDNKLLDTELAPIFLSAENAINLAGETAPTSRNLIASVGGLASGVSLQQETEYFFPLGTHVIVRRRGTASAGADTFALYGEIF